MSFSRAFSSASRDCLSAKGVGGEAPPGRRVVLRRLGRAVAYRTIRRAVVAKRRRVEPRAHVLLARDARERESGPEEPEQLRHGAACSACEP